MWDLLKKADIDEAKRELNLRRAKTLLRHAEERESLDTHRAELETLNKLIDVFLENFPRPAIVSHAPISPPVSRHHAAGKTGHEVKHSGHEAKHPSHEAKHSGHEAKHPGHEAKHPSHEAKHPGHEAKHHSHRHQSQTTYATYMRAVSRA